MYLVPAESVEGSEEDGRGAVIERFDPVEGSPGEVERSGTILVSFRIDKINDEGVYSHNFNDIVGLLVSSGRPIRLTFRDPSAVDHKDAYGFKKEKLHAGSALSYLARSSKESERNDLAWRDFLTELKGASKAPTFSVERLLRDSAGEVTFCEEPAIRLNAVRLSSTTSSTTSAEPGPAADAKEAAHPLQVIGIHKRCWSPASIGFCVPPGMQMSLPGRLPPVRDAERLRERLRSLVLYGGIPVAFRASVWWEVSGAHAKASQHPPYYYKRLTAHSPPPDVLSAIGKDIERTFPGHALFDSAKGQAELRRILSAFALHNPEIGYCQSLNFLAGFLLTLLGEEQAFWVMDVLVNELLPPDYYTHTLLGVQTDQRVLAHLVSVLLPRIHEVYEACGIDLQVVTVGALGRRPPPRAPPPLLHHPTLRAAAGAENPRTRSHTAHTIALHTPPKNTARVVHVLLLHPAAHAHCPEGVGCAVPGGDPRGFQSGSHALPHQL